MFLLGVFFFCPSFGRNPFEIQNKNIDSCNLHKWLPADLYYVGTVFYPKEAVAFVKDPFEQLCKLRVGDRLGFNHYQVVDVLNDQIILSDGKDFSFLK